MKSKIIYFPFWLMNLLYNQRLSVSVRNMVSKSLYSICYNNNSFRASSSRHFKKKEKSPFQRTKCTNCYVYFDVTIFWTIKTINVLGQTYSCYKPTQLEWLLIVYLVSGCTEFGYYYDSTTNTCLKIFHVANNKTWKDARNYCQQDGGDLISLPTRAKWNFTVKFTYCKFYLVKKSQKFM